MHASKDGGYVGFMQEIPIAVQAETLNDIHTRMDICLLEYIKNESLESIPRSMIKVQSEG